MIASRIGPYRTALALCLGLAVVASVRPILGLDASFGDTDDALRLVEARALLAGRHWFDLIEPRLAPPEGLPVHWSRFVDAPIAALLGLFQFLFGARVGELVARAVWPLALFAPAAIFVLANARRLGGETALWTSAALAPLCSLVWGEFTPGRIDHHNVQLALTAFELWCALQARRPHAAAMLGIGAALSLAIGFETLPVIAWATALMGVRFCVNPNEGAATRAFAGAFAIASLIAFAVQTSPTAWTHTTCDALAFNSLAGALGVGAGMWACARWPAATPARRAALLLGATILAGALALSLRPSCLAGPYGDLDPRLVRLWLPNITEARPIWIWLREEPVQAFCGAGFPLAALGAAGWMIARGRRDAPFLAAAGLLAACDIVGLMQARGFILASITAIPVAATALSALAPLPGLRSAASGLALGLLASPMAVEIALTALTGRAAPVAIATAGAAGARPDAAACESRAAFSGLAALPPGVVFADLDAGSHILAATRHAAVSAPYHRLGPQILKALTVFDMPAPQARAEIEATGATYLALCKTGVFAVHARPGGLAAALVAGAPPAWAQPLAPAAGGYLLYRLSFRDGAPL